MRRCPWTHAAILLVGLLVPLSGLRAARASCCVADCDLPCCARDDAHSTMVPVLPCCHTDSADHASTDPAPTTIENAYASVAIPIVVTAALAVPVVPVAVAPPIARLLPAPPLYHRHCALLL